MLSNPCSISDVEICVFNCRMLTKNIFHLPLVIEKTTKATDISSTRWGRARILIEKAFEKLNIKEDLELLVVILILANCVSLAMYNPQEPEDSEWNRNLTKLGR